MKIVVVSDTHGDLSWFERAKHVFDNADCVFHLGDVVSDESSKKNYPAPFITLLATATWQAVLIKSF